jgi:CBS domain-containing protein
MDVIVKDALTPKLVVVERDASLVEVAAELDRADVEVAAVVDPDFSMTAIISDRDIRRAIADGRDPSSTTASEYLTHEARRVDLGDDLDEAIVQMIVAGYHNLLVLENEQLRGIVTESDMLRALMRRGVPAVMVMGRVTAPIAATG